MTTVFAELGRQVDTRSAPPLLHVLSPFSGLDGGYARLLQLYIFGTDPARDECVVFKGEEDPICQKLIEAHKACLRSEGFTVA